MTMEEILEQPTFPTFLDSKKPIPIRKRAPLKILEFGCGPGLVLQQFSGVNECWGLDPSEFAIQYGRKLGLKMVKGTLERAWFEEDYFDLIFGIDALEHTKDPRKGFQNLAAWLKPGGTLIIVVPNAEAAWVKDKKHFLWSPLQHFSIPSGKALRDLADGNGFEVVSLKREGHNLWLKALKRGSS